MWVESVKQLFRRWRAAHLFRYASGYLVIAWTTVTIVDTVGDNLGLPGWIEPSILFLWLALFPLFILFAWLKQRSISEDFSGSSLKLVDYVLLVSMGLLILVSLIDIWKDRGLDTKPMERPDQRTVSIGSKAFLESSVLLEILALVIQEDHPSVLIERNHYIGATPYVLEELKRRNIDMFTDYTGTILAKYLGLDRHYQLDGKWHTRERLNQLLDDDPSLDGISVLGPLGFRNDYVLAMKAEAAADWFDGYEGFTLSRLAAESRKRNLTLGCTYGFLHRVDGLLRLADFYDLRVYEEVQLFHDQKYRALDEKRVDAVVAYATDGQLIEDDRYAVVEDDLRFWPPYYAIPVVSTDFAKENPKIIESLERISGELKVDDIRWCLRELAERGFSSRQIGAGDFQPLTEVVRQRLKKVSLLR